MNSGLFIRMSCEISEAHPKSFLQIQMTASAS